MEFQYYLAAGGLAAALLAVVLYFTTGSGVRIPAAIGGTVGGLVGGIGLGILVMGGLGYHWERQAGSSDANGAAAAPGPGNMQEAAMARRAGPGGGMMGGGMMGGGGGMMGGGGMAGGGTSGRPPGAASQLTSLVAKLDLLTAKPLAINLTDAQKEKVRKQLQGLRKSDMLNENDARKKVDALQDILKDHKDALTAVGYRWPGQGGRSGGGMKPPNPFKADEDGKHLKALEDRLAKKDK